MPTATISFKITGLNEAIAKLQSIADPKKTDARINAAMKKGAAPILEFAKAKAPVRAGDLRRSLIVNSRKLRNGNRSVRVGPDTLTVVSLSGGLSASDSGSIALGRRKKRPANYAHLVEFGTKHSRRRPFMRPANARHGGQKFIGVVSATLLKSYERLARQKGRAS